MLGSNTKVCGNKGFCNVLIPSEDSKTLEFSKYQKSGKRHFIIYADLGSLIENIKGCKNNPEITFTAKVGDHIPSGFSMCTILSFKDISKHHSMKKFCESLRDHTMKIINFKNEKKMKLLKNQNQKSYKNAKFC